MVVLNEPIQVSCDECHCTFVLDLEDFSYTVSNYDHDNGMGMEYVYDFEYIVACPNCGTEIALSLSAQEYPIGAVQTISTNITNGRFTHSVEFEALLD